VSLVVAALLANPTVALAQPTPVVTLIDVPAESLIGEPVVFKVGLDNASATNTGYGPYIDLILPATGIDGAGGALDDGISFVVGGATYLGAPVTTTVLIFDGAGQATHPYARDASNNPVIVTGGTPGDQLVVLQLPFGSFTPTQPMAEVLITATLSNMADANAPLTIRARGGFQYGADPLANAPADPTIIGSYQNVATTPTLMRLKKTYIGPEDETATGPNFPRQYLIEVDIADGQTLTNLDLTDVLPTNLQFVSVTSTTIRGSAQATTAVSTPGTTTPGGTLTRRFASVTGTTALNDATLLFTFFVPRIDAALANVLDPTTGDDAPSPDDARAAGTWAPIDGRDTTGLVTSDALPVDHILTDKSVAIQKGVTVAVDTGAPGPSPGDTLEYTLSIQISDYFAFQNVIVTDIMGDGLRRDMTFVPTLQLTEHGVPSSGNMDPGTFSFVVNSPGTGTTTATFELSNELIARALDGLTLGGCVPDGGTGGPPPDCSVYNGGGTTATIVYRAIIQENYTDTFPSGDPSVDEGDVLLNNVTVAGDLLSTATLAPTGSSEEDDSAEQVEIMRGQLSKAIYAVNGNTSVPANVKITPGDTVTYRLRLTLPTSDIEPLTLTDYLPLPIFDATTVTTFDPTVDATPPPAGQAKFGPGDTFYALSSSAPALSTDAVGNTLTFSYPAFDSPSNPSTAIELLLTVTASNAPFADKLFLTNQVRSSEGTTQLDASTHDSIVQIQLTEPDVKITKGVVATNASSSTFAPAAVGPVAFNAPGTFGARWTVGTVTSTNIDPLVTPINSNLTAGDTGDLVTFAIVLENVGSSTDGAFDVRVRDTLPAGFVVPSTGALLNLHVADGAGATLAYSTLGGGLFDPAGGIELTDGATGAIGVADPSSGTNIVVITYDLQLAAGTVAKTTILNTATLFNFAGTEGGPDHTTVDLSDTATVTTASPTVSKVVLTTDQGHTSGNDVAIGEVVTYEISIDVPEGVTPAAQLVDTMPAGLAFLDLTNVTTSPGISSANAVGAGSGVVASIGAGADNAGRRVTFDFGDITNTNTDNAVTEKITLTIEAVVINGGSNDSGDTRQNSATLSFTGGTATGNAPNVTIVEPTLQVAVSALPASGDAGDTITFTVTLSHAPGSNADAFDVTLQDLVPAGMTFAAMGAVTGTPPTSVTPGSGFSAVWTSFPRYPTASSTTFQFTATFDSNIGPGATITNTATSAWTSLPGVVSTALTPNNTLSTERTGNTGDVGGTENDYRATGTADVTGAAVQTTKTVIGTSLPATLLNDVAVGELVQYQVEVVVPEGVATGVTLVDTLDPGLAFVSFDPITSSGSVTTDVPGGFAAVLANRVVANVGGGLPNDGRRVTFNLGTLTNSDNNNATAEKVTFVYTVIVLNTSANIRGTARNNSAVWTSSASTVTANAPDVTIVEPTLQVVKSAAPATSDAGATVTYTLTISHTGASNADAYDVSLSDVLPAGVTYVPGSLTHTSGVAPATSGEAAGTLSATYATIALGQQSVLTFQATLNGMPTPVTPGQTITNTAAIQWTSLPNVVNTAQSTFNTLSTERTGNTADVGTTANTYAASDAEGVTVASSSIAGFVYVDANNDNVRTGGEAGIAGATIHLTGTDHLGNPVSLTTLTLANGSYSFTGLRAGAYTVTETQPSGYTDGADTVGTPVLGATAGNDVLGIITLPAATSTTAVDFNFGEHTSSDLSVTKTDSPDPVLPGGILTYTIDVVNAGPNAAANAVFTDPLPGGTTFLSLNSPGGWSCTTPGVGAVGTISCTNPSFAAGTATFTLQVTVDAGLAAHSQLRNVATITSSSGDPNPGNNQDDEPTLIAAAGDADLEVTKTDSPDPVTVGQNVTYTITVRNHGPAATDATVTETLPASLSLVSVTPSSGSCSGTGPVTCTFAGMAAGATETITVVAAATQAGTWVNAVTVSGTAPDPNPANDQAAEPTTVLNAGEADVAITKAGPLTVARGGNLTYTLVVTNRGTVAATLVQVTDPLAVAGVTFLSNAGDCGTAFPCDLGTLNPGDTRTIVSTFAVDAAYAGPATIVNTAAVTSTTPDSNLSNNNAAVSTLVGDAASADLTVVKFDSPDAAVAGTAVTYTLVVTNNGPGTAIGVSLVDTLPPNVTYVSSTASQGSCAGPAPVTCTIGSLASGANATIGITVLTSSALPAINPMVNSATVTATSTDPDPSNNTAVQPTTIIAGTDIAITKAGAATVVAGTSLAYTITVTNNGPSDAVNVIVADTTPAGLVFTSNAGDCTTAFPCALGTVPAGASRTITATFAVPANYVGAGPILNTAAVTTDTADTDPGNNSSQASTTLTRDADVSITKAGPALVSAGHLIVYTLTITNNGPSDAAGVLVSDMTPPGLTFVSNAAACTTPFPCALGTLTPGATRVITATFQVPSGHTAPSIVNTAIVSSTTPDSSTANNAATASTTLGPPDADLSVTKTGPANIVPGNTIVYTITVRNNGLADAAGVVLDDPTPADLTFVSNAGDCSTAFPCVIGALLAGETRTVTATFLVPPDYAPDHILNTATVSSTTPDSNPANNSATAQTTTGADIVVTKTVDHVAPHVGDVVRYTITARNAGPSGATGVALTDAMPPALTLVAAAPSQGAYNPASGVWTVGALANGASATLVIDARVTDDGPQINTVTKTAGDQMDPDASNNSAAASLTSSPVADVRVSKTANVAAANVGSPVTFTIVAANAGPSDATGVRIADALPAGLTFVSASATAGVYDAVSGVWDLVTLALDAQATLTLTAVVDQTGPIVNEARKTAQNELDPNPANDASGATVNGLAADIQVVKTVSAPTGASLGRELTFFITATNNGPSAATGVRILDALPANLAYVASTVSRGLYVPQTGVWEIGPLAATGAGATATLQLRAIVVTTDPVISNRAAVMTSDQPDPNPLNNVSVAAIGTVPIDLQDHITVQGDPGAVGTTVDFHVDVTNVGEGTSVEPITVSLPLPSEYRYVPTVQPGWDCTQIGRTIFCRSTATLAPGQYITVGYRAEVLEAPPWGRAIFAHVSTGPDLFPRNDVTQLYVGPPPAPDPDMSVTQTVIVTGAGAAKTLTYTVDVTNQGPFQTDEVILTDVIPAGATFVSATSPAGPCTNVGIYLACELGTILQGHHVPVTIVLSAAAPGVVIHTLSTSSNGHDMYPRDNQSVLVTPLAAPAGADTDGDGMPDSWESQMGLSVATADASADADGDGVSNIDEYRQGTHPRGSRRLYFAEGASNGFFTTTLSVLNPDAATAASVMVELLKEDGTIVSVPHLLAPLGRIEVDAASLLPAGGTFSVLVESDKPVAADRDMRWDSTGYGSSGESGIPAPSTTWFFAEGATNPYSLFYLIENPSMTQAADVQVTYLLSGGRPPIVTTETVAPHARLTVFVNDLAALYPQLASTEVGAKIVSTNHVPIVAERAMYLYVPGQPMGAGHAGEGAAAPSSSWFFAEGATGAFFNEFLLLANPNAGAAVATVRYLLPDGTAFEKTYPLDPTSRRTIEVAAEDPRLKSTSVAATITSTLPIVAERAMWWPGRSLSPEWYEAHVSLGATATGMAWAMAGGAVGGAVGEQTYGLVANQESRTGQARVTAAFDDGTSIARTIDLPQTSRTTIDFGSLFPEARGRHFSAVIESIGATPVPIVVEWSRYSSPGGQFWGAGSAALATRIR
jgi:uncharacterized repeat protein (TIGR01451 family)/fimbrial isopeptide formation D2 family protein